MNIFDKIRQSEELMTATQKKIADYLLSHSFDAAFLTIEQFAQDTHTSTASVIRFCTFLGFSGYSDFQRALQEMLRGKVNPKTRLDINLKNLSTDNLWAQCHHRQMENINATLEAVSPDVLNQVIRQIISARMIYIVSARGGKMIADYLHAFFLRMLGNCTMLDSEDMATWSTIVPTIDSRDLVIALTFPRYAARLLTLLKCIKEKKGFVVSFTDSYSSPVVPLSNILLPCSCSSLGFHNSPTAAMVIADSIISVLAIRYSDQVKKRLEAASSIMDENQFYIHR